MKILSDEQYKKELQKIKETNKQKEYQSQLKTEKDKYKKHIKIETSKILAIYLFVVLNTIVIYAMTAMWKFADFTYLGVLITDIAAQILIYGIYCMKAYKAKRSEEEIKLKRDEYFGNIENILSAGAECEDEIPFIEGNLEETECSTTNTDTESVG